MCKQWGISKKIELGIVDSSAAVSKYVCAYTLSLVCQIVLIVFHNTVTVHFVIAIGVFFPIYFHVAKQSFHKTLLLCLLF